MAQTLLILVVFLTSFQAFSEDEVNIHPAIAKDGEITVDTLQAELKQFQAISKLYIMREKVETQEIAVAGAKAALKTTQNLVKRGVRTKNNGLKALSNLAVQEAELKRLKAKKKIVNFEAILQKYLVVHNGDDTKDKRMEVALSMAKIYDAQVEMYEAEIEKIEAELLYHVKVADTGKKLVAQGVMAPMEGLSREFNRDMRIERIGKIKKIIKAIKLGKKFLNKNIEELSVGLVD